MPTTGPKTLGWFKTKDQCRKHFDQEELIQLGKSLREKQLQPLVAMPDGTIVCGERRLRAALLEGLEFLEVKILDEQLTESQIKVYRLTENIQRVDLSPAEQWLAFLELQHIHPEKNHKEFAELLHKDPSWVTRTASVSACIASVQEAFIAGKLGISACYAISKVAPEEQEALLQLKLNGGASCDTLEAVRRKSKKTASPAARVSKLKIPLPSGACVTISGEELSLDDVLAALQDVMKAARKASDEGLDGRTWQRVMADKAKPASA